MVDVFNQKVADVLPVVSRARGWRACGLGVCAAEAGHAGTCDEASGWAEWLGEFTPAEAAVIAAELVACTLGQRVRPELQVTPREFVRGRLAHLAETVKRAVDAAAARPAV